MSDRNSLWSIPVLLAVSAAGGLMYYWSQSNSPEPLAEPGASAPEVAETKSTGPAYPLPVVEPTAGQEDDLVPLPPLAESDKYFKLDMAGLFGSGISELLVDTAVIEKIVVTVDNLPRDHIAERIRPISGVVGPYLADGQDGSGEYTINADNYGRYDFLVNLLAAADINVLVEIYQRYYPLFQEAYAGLGYPNAYFNDRAIAVIDHLLLTPNIPEPVELVRPHVLYEYADPKLEALSSGQKMLLRMGDEHAVRVKQFLEELRIELAASSP
jgi:hypothetical protein